jgi:hypothetical protein
MQQRESAKKAAASAAVAAAASTRGTGVVTSNLTSETSGSTENTRGHPVAETASWLDRAKLALKEPSQTTSEKAQERDLKNQMQEVQRLIQEGPAVQQTSAVLPDVLDNATEESPPRAESPGSEPADKRMRTAEDAEALVGFLRSVRASAASGEDF